MRSLLALVVCIGCGLANAQVVPWFYGSGINSVLPDFLQAPKTQGIDVVQDSGDAAAILASGYQVMGGLPAEAAACAQNDAPNCADIVDGRSYIEGVIDGLASSGVTWVFVNEPCVTTDDMTQGDPCSIPYNAIGMDIIVKYVADKNYQLKVGYSLANGDAPIAFKQLFDWTASNSYRLMDFIQEENYNSTCCADADPFAAFHAAYPNVLRSSLIYSVNTLCAFPYEDVNGTLDMIGFWDVDNYGGWIGPLIDPNQLAAGKILGEKRDKSLICNQTFSEVDPANWTWNVQRRNFSWKIDDGSYSGWQSPYAISSCEYQVYSGANAIDGLEGVVQTWPAAGGWASRACNGKVTVTVGPGKNCRDKGQNTCLLVVRHHNDSPGGLGNVTWQEISVTW